MAEPSPSSPSEAPPPPPLPPKAFERKASDGAPPPIPPRPRNPPSLSIPPAEQPASDRAANGAAGGGATLPPTPNATASPAGESNSPQIYIPMPPLTPGRHAERDARSMQIRASGPQEQLPVELVDTSQTEASGRYGQAMVPPRAPTSAALTLVAPTTSAVFTSAAPTTSAAVGRQGQENSSDESEYIRSSTPPVRRPRHKSSSSVLPAFTDSNTGQSPANACIRKPRRRPLPATNGSARPFRCELVELTDGLDTYGSGSASSTSSSSSQPSRRQPPARQFSSPDTECAQDLKRARAPAPRAPPTRPAFKKSLSELALAADGEEYLISISPKSSPNGTSTNFATTTIGCIFPRERDSRLAAAAVRRPPEVQFDRRTLSKPNSNLSHSKRLIAIDSSGDSTSSLNNPSQSSPLTRSPDNRGRALLVSTGARLGSARNLCGNGEGRDQFGLTFPLNPATLSSDLMSRSMIALNSSHAFFHNSSPERLNGVNRLDAAESPAPGSSPPPDFKTLPARPKPSPLGSPLAAARFSGRTSTRIGSEAPIEPHVMWRRGTRGAPSDSTARSASRQPQSSQLPPLREVEVEECPQHAVPRLSAQLVRFTCFLSGVIV